MSRCGSPRCARRRRCGPAQLEERDSMIRSRRVALTASLLGALLIAGAPTLAFGAGDATHDAKGYSATAASDDDIAAQKAKDDEKKEADKKADSKADKKDKGSKQAAEKKND